MTNSWYEYCDVECTVYEVRLVLVLRLKGLSAQSSLDDTYAGARQFGVKEYPFGASWGPWLLTIETSS